MLSETQDLTLEWKRKKTQETYPVSEKPLFAELFGDDAFVAVSTAKQKKEHLWKNS